MKYLSLVITLVFFLNAAFCQESNKEVLIKMENGEEYQGEIINTNQETLVLKTRNGQLDLIASKIASIEDVEDYDGKYHYKNPNDTRYFFGPSARTLKKGKGYYQNINVLFNSANIGITDNISIGGGFEFISTVIFQEPLWFLTPKVGFPISEKWSVGAGLLIGGLGTQGGGGLGYGVVTYGSADSNMTVGLGYGFGSSEPLLVLSGMHRLGKSISLVSENYFASTGTQDTDEFSSGLGTFGIQGIRIIGKKNSFDIGLIIIPEIVEYVPALPYVGYVRTF